MLPRVTDSSAGPLAVLHLPALTEPSRTPLVAVPGLGLSLEVPARTLCLLQQVVGSIVVALPGYGMPHEGGRAADPAVLAARLLHHREIRGLPRTVLLGHSASCQIVVEAAVQDPSKVTGLILVGPTTDPRADSWPRLARRWLRTAAWERLTQVPVLVRDYRHTGLLEMGRAMDVARRHRIDHALKRVSCPVLVVRGRHDRIAPADWASALASTTAQGRAVTLARGAHMIPITHPSALAAQLNAALPSM
jgi:pimeloyl-ACP methyl ester carboxylesterase